MAQGWKTGSKIIRKGPSKMRKVKYLITYVKQLCSARRLESEEHPFIASMEVSLFAEHSR